MLRLTSLAARLSAFGVSAAVHGAVFLMPMGHAGTSRTASDTISLEVLPEPAPTDEAEPEPVPTARAGLATILPSHTHPYPVPADHDLIPHDPNLQHLPVPAQAPSPAPPGPAPAAPVETAADDGPHFKMVIGAASDAHGSVSSSDSAAPQHDDQRPVSAAQVDVQARLVRGLPPSYPEGAREDGIQGDVGVELVLGLAGNVESARVVRAMGHGLDAAALAAVRRYVFAPAMKDGHAVRVRMNWDVQFRLR